MENYVKWKSSTVQANTVPHYIRWVKRFQKITGKTANFTLHDITKFKLALEKHGYSPKNIQFGLHIIRDYLNYLIAVEGLNFPIHLLRIKQERSNSHHPVTEEEYQIMLSVLPQNRPITLQRRLLLMMLHDTGMRGGELLSLKLGDIGHRHAIINNKKNKRKRLVSWSEATEKLLQFYLPLRENMVTQEQWLFVSFKWKPTRCLTIRQLERIVQQIRLKAGITSVVRPHSFRHGFVHRQLGEGKPITTVAQMLGHSTTMNVLTYAQLSSKEIYEAWGLV